MKYDNRHSIALSILMTLALGAPVRLFAEPPAKSSEVRTVTIPVPDSKSPNSYFEPHISIDPENADRIAVAAMFVGRVGDGDEARAESQIFVVQSEDGGQTWSKPIAPFELSPRPRARIGADPVVAFADSRTVWLAGDDYDFPTKGIPGYQSVKVARSTDGGKKWSPPITVAGLDNDKKRIGVVDKPWIAVDTGAGKRRGTLYVAWSHLNDVAARCELWCAALPPGAERFEPKVMLGDAVDLKAGTFLIHQVQLAARPDGTLDALWRLAPKNQLIHAYSTDGARSFSKAAAIATDALGEFPSLAAKSNGDLLAAWTNRGGISCSVHSSNRWSAPYQLPTAAKSRLSHPASAAADALWVSAYREMASGRRLSVVLFKSDDQGKKWEEYEVLATRTSASGENQSFDPGHYFGLAAAKDRLYAVYTLPGEGRESARPQLYLSTLKLKPGRRPEP